MEILTAIWEFITHLLFYGWADEDVILAIDPVTIILVSIALAETGKKAADEKKKAEFERALGKLTAEERALLLEQAQKKKNAQEQQAIVLQAIADREALDKRREKIGLYIGIGGVILSVILILYLTNNKKK